MNKPKHRKYTLVIVSGVLIGSAFLLALAVNKKEDTALAAPAGGVLTYNKCIESAETNYKTYVRTNGSPGAESYADKFYSLTDVEEKTVNSTRAAAYTDCFNKYGEKLPTPS